jgi:predicted transcriptional regulator
VAKLSISIPDELKVQLDERADAENVPVSHVVTEALRAFFGSPPDQAPGTQLSLADQLREVQAYLWDLHFSHESTRATALNLYYWAQRHGENMGMPPDEEMPKPSWPKSKPG